MNCLSEYPKRSYYVTYDVSDQLKEGENAESLGLTGKEIYKSEVFRMIENYKYLEKIIVPMKEMRKALDYNDMTDIIGDEFY